jgi:S1-C subfamily serine protease
MLKLKLLKTPLILLFAFVVGYFIGFEIPPLYRDWLRNKVSSRVFEVRGTKVGGGGTGFQVEAPSGKQYIVTNSHVCESVLKDANGKDFLLVRKGDHFMKRQVLEISEETDLCLIENWPNLSGLSLGSEPEVGDIVSAVGHPLLGPTAMTTGEVTSFEDVSIPTFTMKTGEKKFDESIDASDEPCDKFKNEIKEELQFFFFLNKLKKVKICYINELHAMNTTVPIYSGNSGSPLVDKWGQIVGVVFASERRSNWGTAVSLSHLEKLLKDY